MRHAWIMLAVCCGLGATFPLHADPWPQWRGPTGDGVSRETGLPITWNEETGVRWKCGLPEWGTSTPAIWNHALFVTSHVDDQRLVLLRIDTRNGRIEWTREIDTGTAPRVATRTTSKPRGSQKFHRTQNLASPSPVTDGQVVIVHFGNGDLAAYDFDGNLLWQRNLQQDHGPYTIWWGHANSPVLYEDLVISVCMQDSCQDIQSEPSPSYLVAHDKRTGQPRWKTMRMTGATLEHCDSYTTPIFRQAEGQVQMIVMGGEVLDAYAPKTGTRLWYSPEVRGNRVIPSPVAAQGMVYAICGMRGPLVAMEPVGQGEQSPDRVVWTFDEGITSDSPSPVVAGDLLFMVTNNGIVRCFDVHTGQVLWRERLKGEYRASPIVAEDRIYFLNVKGLTTVIPASRRFQRLAENPLDDDTIASPATSDGNIYIRGRKWLYCLGS